MDVGCALGGAAIAACGIKNFRRSETKNKRILAISQIGIGLLATSWGLVGLLGSKPQPYQSETSEKLTPRIVKRACSEALEKGDLPAYGMSESYHDRRVQLPAFNVSEHMDQVLYGAYYDRRSLTECMAGLSKEGRGYLREQGLGDLDKFEFKAVTPGGNKITGVLWKSWGYAHWW